jgi:hypothetical protein
MGRGSQWLGSHSVPDHPAGIVSSRHHETRMVPLDRSRRVLGADEVGSKIRIRLPSFGAVLIGCHSGNMPAPKRQSNADRRNALPPCAEPHLQHSRQLVRIRPPRLKGARYAVVRQYPVRAAGTLSGRSVLMGTLATRPSFVSGGWGTCFRHC